MLDGHSDAKTAASWALSLEARSDATWAAVSGVRTEQASAPTKPPGVVRKLSRLKGWMGRWLLRRLQQRRKDGRLQRARWSDRRFCSVDFIVIEAAESEACHMVGLSVSFRNNFESNFWQDVHTKSTLVAHNYAKSLHLVCVALVGTTVMCKKCTFFFA